MKKSPGSGYGVHWFRRDLRIRGNLALAETRDRHDGRVLGVFCFDPSFLSRPDFSHDRFALFMNTLAHLQEDLRKEGSELLVLACGAEGAASFFDGLFRALAKGPEGLPLSFSHGRDYEPFARARDASVRAVIEGFEVPVFTARDHLLIEPDETRKDNGTPYQVFTPFCRRWFEKMKTPEIDRRIEDSIRLLKPGKTPHFHMQWKEVLRPADRWTDRLEEFRRKNSKSVNVEIPETGAAEIARRLKAFRGKIDSYATTRDFPGEAGTSRFSMYLKNGSLTVPQIIHALDLRECGFREKEGTPAANRSKFLKELVWREFYYSILWHSPRVESEAFNEKYKHLKWENRKTHFEAWKSGRTGYPIVDAGMRELLQTGWMHNRVRMIVASFLTKDLLIDWKWGEKYFMERLLDGDLAPNNGGWQWAASTGCDPQPYFRIFNPIEQGKKFDPEAIYIKKFVPELRELSASEIHTLPLRPLKVVYPKPIVEHRERRTLALRLYQSAGR